MDISISMSIVDKHKELIINVYGWTGSICIVIAYIFTLNCNYDNETKNKQLLINLLNIYGCISIGYICFRQKTYQPLLLEIIWLIVSIYSIIDLSLQ